MSKTTPHLIAADELYRMDEAQERLGLGVAAMRTARKNGLRVCYLGGRAFVSGRELIRYIKSNGEPTK